MLRLLTRQLEILKMRERINSQIKEEMGKNQREYVLRQQLKAIKEELGEDDGDQGDLDGIEERIAKANLPTEAETRRQEAAQAPALDAGRLGRVHRRPHLPRLDPRPAVDEHRRRTTWTSPTVRKVLDEDHYGLEKVKKRILEYLAVRKLKQDKKGPILCLIGPPGVGKTSLGRSIARALGRKFVRISLGGVHDEAAIRGHRRTYVGALPGQIIQGMKKAGTINPVFMIDEVDKIGHDFRGDPSAALLEVLDPEQNNTFADHYLEIPYDLSNVMFIATANIADPIPPPLRDRMEILEIPGYTRREKLAIADQHLLPKQLEEHGLTTEQLDITDAAIEEIIDQLHARSGRPQPRAADRQRHPRRRGEGRRGRHEPAHDRRPKTICASSSAPPKFTSEVAERTEETGRRHGPRVDERRRRDPLHRGDAHVRHRQAAAHRAARRRHEGVGAGRALATCAPTRSATASPKDFLEKSDVHIHIPAGAHAQGRPERRRDDVHGARLACSPASASATTWR